MENLYPTSHELQSQDLTWREQEVLSLLAGRLSNKEISAKLHLSVSTVKWYNHQIFAKLGVSNRNQAAKKASDLRLMEVQEKIPAEEIPKLLNNLPAQLNSFVGRKKEVADIKELLKSARLIGLTGAGGSGKTRLALQVAQELVNAYADGVWLVKLADITDPAAVPIEIASVLKLNTRGEIKHIELLKRSLIGKELLLVLDNFEHLEEAASILSEMLAAAPQLTILVTSRAKLKIYGEQEYSLSPLNLPELNQRASSERLLESEAVELFIKRARAALPGLALDKEDIEAAAKICILLDGLPLALELAAPLVKIYGFSPLAQRLNEDLEALPEGPRDIPARQRTLRATMDWSYQLLEEDDKRLFERLSIFRGGGALEAIQSICGEGLPGSVIGRLISLVENNLVIPIETADGDLHFTMLETIKEFSCERLASRPGAGEISRKHAAYYADLAELSLSEIRGKRNSYWFTRLGLENKNFQSALAWSLEGEEPEFGFRMVGPLSYFWYYNGISRENSLWINLALEKSTRAAPLVRAKVLLTAGMDAYDLSDLVQSRDLLWRALEIFRELGEKLYEGIALAHLSLASLRSTQNPDKVLAMALEGLEIIQNFEHKGYMAMAYDILGYITRIQGDYTAAKKYYLESLAISQETGEKIREATLYSYLGVIAFHQADYETADQRNKQGLSLSMELPSVYGIAIQLALLAGPIGALGFPIRAARILGAAEAELDKMEDDQIPVDQPEITLYKNATQKALGEKAFQEAWQDGQAMSIQEAAAYALGAEDADG